MLKFTDLPVRGITCMLLLLLTLSLPAQNDTAFTFNAEPLVEVFKAVEQKTPYRFYFEESWIRDVLISGQFEVDSMELMLSELLDETLLEFIIVGNRVILAHNTPFITSLNKEASVTQSQYIFAREYREGGKNQVVIGDRSEMKPGGESLLVGFVRDKDSGDPVAGAVVRISGTDRNTITDVSGFYAIKVPNGQNELTVQFSGMKQEQRSIIVFSEGELNLKMEPESILLDEVAVSADRDANIHGVKMGVSALNMNELKNAPKILGENDVVQVALTLPGVQNVGEGSSGINVRGGKSDQNLILFDHATVYNPFHFFGFFSVFNADIMGETELYKNSIPVSYGGRLSSLLDISLKQGNKEEFTAVGGINPITSRLAIEVPLVKKKTSLITGVRSTYSDWILNRVNNTNIRNSDPSFLDVAAGLDHSYGKNSSVKLSGYYSHDQFKLSTDSLYEYSNFLTSLSWRHFFNERVAANVILTTSRYNYGVSYETQPELSFRYGFEIEDVYGQGTLSYFLGSRHELQAGLDARRYHLKPGNRQPLNEASEIEPETLPDEFGLEQSVFFSDQFKVDDDLTITGGIRYSFFSALGGRTIHYYQSSQPRNEQSLISSVAYSRGEIINTYGGPELRASIKYGLSPTSSLKAAFNNTRQYIHAISNNIAVSPTDTWKLSDPNFKPQQAKQISLGYFRNFRSNAIESSVEVYYKKFDNLVDYKVGADLVMNPMLEQDVIQGVGRAYGIEFFVRKNTGKLTGWISYTYSRSQQRYRSAYQSETINNGDYFPSNHEKPHDLSLISNYKYTRRYSFSLNLNYSTGRPITYPTAKYQLGGTEIIHFADRNKYRIPDYFRIDLSVNIEGSHKVNKPAHGYWSFSVYNLLGRNNVYSVFFVNQNGEIKGYELSVFGQPIPSITYNFKI